MQLNVYVPADPNERLGIWPGSAIVGEPADPDGIRVDYEGGRHMATFALRLLHAAGRHVERYPTTARMTLPADALRAVGTYDYEPHRPTGENRLDVHEQQALDAWIARFEGA